MNFVYGAVGTIFNFIKPASSDIKSLLINIICIHKLLGGVITAVP